MDTLIGFLIGTFIGASLGVFLMALAVAAKREDDCLEDVPTVECEDTISRQAVKQLDLFTKTYCRDKSIEDDLVFRCNQCEFEMPDGRCLAKVMARKLCPDYRDFGCMGDL